MKQEFFSTRELSLPGGRVVPAGELVATVETPDGIDPERALNAIRSGFATAGKPAPAPAAPEAKGKGK